MAMRVCHNFAPSTRILVTAAAPFIRRKINRSVETWRQNGNPVNEGQLQRMIRLTKHPEGTVSEEAFDLFSFVPMVGGRNH